ncbi:hypothetical protein MMC21_003838 [Puttea exsequens]|nr:hypothetical protein [Puttea exsequens]
MALPRSVEVHTALDPAEEAIRVLRLHPGQREDKILCDLEIVSLKDEPIYVAVSYAWGSEDDQEAILLQGQVCRITRNLEEALRGLRRPNEPICLWIDAICINQADLNEKSSQVSMMSQIYSKASQTWVWLGPASSDSDAAMDFVASVTAEVFEDPELPVKLAPWKACETLLKRPWWSRMWIVQEVCLSQQVLVRCGTKTIEMDHFVELKALHHKYYWSDSERYAQLRLFTGVPFSICLSYWKLAKNERETGGGMLMSWLTITETFQCTLGKDKIFALFGLLNKAERALFQPDYTKSDRQVFVETAASCVQREGLRAIQLRQEDKVLDLPSWVPDYSSSTIYIDLSGANEYSSDGSQIDWERLGLPQWTMPGESRSGDNAVRFSKDYETMAVRALIVDSVDFIDPAPHVELYRGLDTIRAAQVRRLRRDLTVKTAKTWETHAKSHPGSVYDPLRRRYDAFWRTLILDRLEDWQSAPPPAFADRFEAWMGRNESAEFTGMSNMDQERYVGPYGNAVVNRCLKRAFITTVKGYFGLASAKTQTGDLICVIRCGNVPFVLRKSGTTCYKFIGESYVHGLMSSECFQTAHEGDVKEIWIR